jgi:hypothetical protein
MELQISSPCPLSWESLRGDDRVRFCSKCSLKVYNLARMSSEDVERVVLKSEGRLCGRLYVRDDQTATAKNCPDRLLRKRTRTAFVALALLLASATCWIWKPHRGLDRSVLPPPLREIADWIDPEPKVMLGSVCPTVPSPVPAPPGPAFTPSENP